MGYVALGSAGNVQPASPPPGGLTAPTGVPIYAGEDDAADSMLANAMCPGQEVYDDTIGACTCPKGMVTTMVVGECQLEKGAATSFKKTAGACNNPADCPGDWTAPGQNPFATCPDGPESTWVSQFGLTHAQIQMKFGGCLCKDGFRWSEEGAQCVPVSRVGRGQPGPGGRPGGGKPSTRTSKAGISLGTGTMVGLAVGAAILLGAWAWEPGPPARKPLR